MKRNYIVTKSNKLVFSRYDLTLQEQRIILALMSMIDSKKETEFYEYMMTVKEFTELLGVQNANQSYLNGVVNGLMTKVVEIEDEKRIVKIHWLSSCIYYKGQGLIKLELHRELIPHLLNLKSQFTTYYLSNIIQMKSKYSVRLYEIFKSNQFKKHFTITLDDIRNMLMAESYTTYSNFKLRILDPVLKEINKHTDIIVQYIPIKTGRNITSIEFIVTGKRKLEQELYGEA